MMGRNRAEWPQDGRFRPHPIQDKGQQLSTWEHRDSWATDCRAIVRPNPPRAETGSHASTRRHWRGHLRTSGEYVARVRSSTSKGAGPLAVAAAAQQKAAPAGGDGVRYPRTVMEDAA